MPSQKEIAEEIAQAGYENPCLFAHYFFPHWFGGTHPIDIKEDEDYKLPNEMPWLHRGMLAILTGRSQFLWEYGDYQVDKIERNFVYNEIPGDESSPLIPVFQVDWENRTIKLLDKNLILLMIPRGFAKTTLMNVVNAYKILYRDAKFPVYLSESGTHASQQLGNVKAEFEENPRIHAVFGLLQPKQREGKWTEIEIHTTTGIPVIAMGRGSQIRGKNIRSQRPDFIMIDDVEDEESVKTHEQRDKTKTWFYGAVLPALPTGGGGRIVFAGTLLHDEALLQNLRRDPEFISIVFGAYDCDGDLLWAWHMDEAALTKKKRSFQIQGKLNLFYMEYFNTLRHDDSSKFKQQYILYEPRPEFLQTAIAIDPAISTQERASECAIVVWGMSEKGLLWKLDEVAQVGMSVREQVDHYFRLSKLHECRYHGVESIAYQAALTHLLREEMFRKKRYFEITPIVHASNTKKEDRISGILQPRYSAGYVRHAKRFPESEAQLLDFPNGKLDRIDADSMAVGLLDPHAAMAIPDDHDPEADEYEDDIGDEYRHAP